MAEAAADAFETCSERMSQREFYRRRPAFIVDRVYQGTIFRSHVDRLHNDAAMLQDPLGAQQKPRADCIKRTQRATVDLDTGGPGDLQRPQGGIEAAGLADDPKAPNDQTESAALAFGSIPRSVLCCGRTNYRPHSVTGSLPRRRSFGVLRV